MCGNLPKGKYFMADQLRRASLSISLNIAEGNGRWHKAEKRQFFTIARGSACECVPILELLRRDGSIDSKTHDQLNVEIDRHAK
ncbi:MAG: four helix bundle protein [Actinomycetota bacterium]|nr:four helix bundle protein [Actinomycetota bacterium]